MTVLNGWLETVSICRLSLYIQHEHSASLRGFIAVCWQEEGAGCQ